MIIKFFDALTPIDQLLLKCASVLGDTIGRKLLEHLLTGIPKIEIANCKFLSLF